MTRLALIAGAACALAGTARADTLEAIGGDGDGRVVELRHEVDAQLADRTATFRVERELSNAGAQIVRGELSIDLPTRGVVRGFRVLAGDRWIEGELLPATQAADEFERLTTTGAQLAHGPALMEWIGDGEVRGRAYPLAPGARLRVAYTIEAPVCYAAGRWIAEYPDGGGEGMARPILRAHGARVFTAAQLAHELGRPLDEACAADLPLTADDAHRYLVVDAPVAAPAAVRFTRATAGHAALVRVSIDVAAELAPPPRGARVVFVVDASRTLGDDGIAAQLAWARAYLAHVPDATFEIVLYRRFPERVFGRFEPAARAAALIDGIDPARLVPGNGSFLDRGLATAAQLLVPGGGPRRVVAFTDERWRQAWDAPQAAGALAALPPDAIVHLARVSRDADTIPPSLTRRGDDDPLAVVAARWGGMMVDLTAGARAPHDAIAAAALELVKPMHLDEARLRRGGDDDEDLGALDPGAGVYRAWRVKGTGPIVVEGKIWGRTWRHELPADAPSWAALAIGDPVRSELDDREVLALATTAAVVSPMTSFLAVDRRFGPARLPEGWGEGAFCGCDTSGIIGGSIGTSTTCGIGTGMTIPPPDPQVLAGALAPRTLACAVQYGQRRWDVTVAIDTTGDEIVDVAVRGADDAGFRACVEDAAWDLTLDARFARFTRAYDVRVAGAR